MTVPIEEPVYRQLDKLASQGLIKTRLLGQRPYVRAEIARLVAEAIENYPLFAAKCRDAAGNTIHESAKLYVDRTLEELKLEYHDELVQRGVLPGTTPRVQGQAIEQPRFDFLYLNQDPAIFPLDNGLGGLAAETRSLVEQRGGRHYQNGLNLAVETTHWLRLGKYLSFAVEPRFQVQSVQGNAPAESKVFVQRLNGHFTWNKLDIEIGRDSLNWGTSTWGGLAFSNNARPLDFIKLSSVSPFQYPFLFKKMGINEWSLVVANLGSEQRFKRAWLVAFKNSNRGSPYFELGFSNIMISGGEGAPGLGVGQGFLALLGGGSSQAKASSLFNADFDLIGNIPKLRGMNIYAELNFADFTIHPTVLFGQDFSVLTGIYLPRLNDSGSLDLRVEYRRLGPRYARDELYTDGVTENRLLIGDPLGPSAYGISAELNYDVSPETLLTAGIRFAQRSATFYGSPPATLPDRPQESRFRVTTSLRHRFTPHLVARLDFGIDQVHNFNFVRNDDQTQWLGQAGFTFYLRPYLGIGRGH